MTRAVHAFADEYGNNSFDFETQGSHFIVASVVVRDESLKATEDLVEEVRKRHFQTGEIKSVKVADNSKRRLRVLQDLIQADFTLFAVAVDKRRLHGEGFKYKKSFYKFLNNLVYKELYAAFPRLVLMVDEHGENPFMREFKKYVQRKHIPDLFGGADFGFAPSANSVLIQLADFMAGTLARCFDERLKDEESASYMTLLRPKLTGIHQFPDSHFRPNLDAVSGAYDEDVAQMGIQSATHFIDGKSINGQDDIDQVNCARLLLLYFRNYGTHRYLSANELIQHLNAGRPEPIKQRRLQAKIIAPLRDAGVLVVSSATGDKMGYKLPSSLEDLHKFVSHGNSMIIPMLSRIRLFREKIRLASHNDIDILAHDEFKELRRLME